MYSDQLILFELPADSPIAVPQFHQQFLEDLEYLTIYMSQAEEDLQDEFSKEKILTVSDIEYKKNDPNETMSHFNPKLQ